jgi:hypothetical protein
MSATIVQACGILQNFLVDERTAAENDDDVMLDAYMKDLEEATKKKGAAAVDPNIQPESDEIIYQGADEGLNRQINLFAKFNQMKV